MSDKLYLTFDDICRNIKRIKHQIQDSNKNMMLYLLFQVEN